MRICQVLPEFIMGGAEAMCITLSAELQKMGHDVCIVSLRTYESALTERARSYGIEIHFMDKELGLDLSCIPQLRRFFRSWKPDVIHTHLHALKYVYAACIGLHIPIIRTIHTTATNEKSRETQLYSFLYRHQKVTLVALSEAVHQSIINTYHLKPDTVPIIENGVDLTRCFPKNDYSISAPAKIVHVGRFFAVKNHRIMIQAAKLLQEKGISAEMLFYGDGPLEEEMKALSRGLGLNNIHFNGVCANVFPKLHEADIFVLPSSCEGIPISLIEAMGSGLPIVASNVGGIPDMIEDEQSGILIQPCPESLAAAIARLIKDASLREALGRQAKMDAKRFSAQTMAKNYAALYQTLI